MTYVRDSNKSVEDAVAAIEEAAQARGFGVLHTYDLKALLDDKGFALPNACRILEVCKPDLASEILQRDMTMNLALPCRVSVFEDGGRTRVGMIRPTELLGLISDSEELRKVAGDVESTIEAIIDEAL